MEKVSLGLTRVVDTSLDDVIQGVATGCLLVPQLAINVFIEDFGHMVVVLGQVRELLVNCVVELEVVVGVSERHDCFLNTAKRGQERNSVKMEPQDDSSHPTASGKNLEIGGILFANIIRL